MLYLVENPIVRDAFFPSGSDELTLEPARAEDRAAIAAMSAAQQSPEATALVEAWWHAAPDAFRVVRDAAGMVHGFSCRCQPQDVSRSLLRSDPVTAAWMEHLRRAPVPSGQRVLFSRHALACSDLARAKLWLDVKRVYLELRPHLRRLYTHVPDVDRALAVLAPLGFAALPGAPVQIGQDAHWTLVNDFGPGSIDGWLTEVVGRELAADEPTVLDPAARRLVLDGRAVDLSRLELDVLAHLRHREGIAVSREELLREVWGHQWTGASSNVVEAVVSGLRRKMGDRAAALQTVRGIGYRLGPLD
jgi:DNA-binding response OmpR family regulator